MKRLDLKIGFSCNNFCKFCVQGEKRKTIGDKTLERIKKEMELGAREGYEEIVITGGEPTIRKDIFEIVSFAKKLGFKNIQIQSNGRMFAYFDFCVEIVKAGATEFALALHGHNEECHDYLTSSPGSFKQTVNGIINLKKLGQKVIMNTVITKSNYRHLPEIAKLLIALNVDQFQFAMVHALGRAKENFDSIVPHFTLIEPYVKKALEIGIKAGKKVMTEAIPYCFMLGYEDCVAEKIIPSTKIYDFNFVVEDFTIARKVEGKAKGPQCKKCIFYSECEGPWKEYPERFGWGEFKPVLKKERKEIYLGENSVQNFQSSFHKIFTNLITYTGCDRHKEEILLTKNILFSNFNVNWLSQNQKFDFSVSFKKKIKKFFSFFI